MTSIDNSTNAAKITVRDTEDDAVDVALNFWSRYSSHLESEWREKSVAVTSSATAQEVAEEEDNVFDSTPFISEYQVALSGGKLIHSEYNLSENSVATTHTSVENSALGNGSDSSHGKTASRLKPPLLTAFPFQDLSLDPKSTPHRNEKHLQCASHLVASKSCEESHTSMAHNDESFWAVTASLLGPDFDFDAASIRVQIESLEITSTRSNCRTYPCIVSTSTPRSDTTQSCTESIFHISPGISYDPPTSSEFRPVLAHGILQSLGQSWQWFTSASSLQLYINTLKQSHNFGVCFLDQDGSRCCCIMRANNTKRQYSLPAPQYWATKDSNHEFPDPGCKSIFWWCLPPSLSTEPDPALVETFKELHRRYESAKVLVDTFKEQTTIVQTGREELRTGYKRLLTDLPLREKLTGRFSIDAMNTILVLSDLAEALGMVFEARKWNFELVSRRARRLGRNSEHTCQARYKLGAFLLETGDYDAARDVSRENLECLQEMAPTASLVLRQNIQSCSIAMKRRRLEQALEVLPHLWAVERWYEKDLRTRDQALSVLVEATLFRHQFIEAEAWVKKRIALFDGQSPDPKSRFGDHQHRGYIYIQLASCLKRQGRLEAASEAARIALKLYKDDDNMQGHDESVCETYNLLGKLYFDMKEWNKARFYLEKAANGYTETLGGEHEKSVKARELLEVLEKSMRIRKGLAEKIAKHKEKKRSKKTY